MSHHRWHGGAAAGSCTTGRVTGSLHTDIARASVVTLLPATGDKRRSGWLQADMDAIEGDRPGLSGAILRLPCESSSSAAFTRRRMGFTVGLVLEAAISEKIASYDQPQHPE
jgi:hypothetical protein